MGDVSSTLKLENGKHYRWVVEGEWTSDDRTFGDLARVKVYPEEVVSIEEIRGPEPEWKRGTVVKTLTYLPFIKAEEGWTSITRANVHTFDRVISEAWKAGTLQILYTPED